MYQHRSIAKYGYEGRTYLEHMGSAVKIKS